MHEGPVPEGTECPGGEFLRDPSLYLREFRRKTTENSERIGQQALPTIELVTSRLPV